jgi:nucleoid DNA-binding protein
MKKTELDKDPVGKQVLWMKIRTNKTPGSNQFKLMPVIAKSLWHRSNSGIDDRYLTVAEYDRPDRTHDVHLQALQAMTPEEAAKYPLKLPAPDECKPMLRRKDLAKRLACRVQVSETRALAWIQHVEEEMMLALSQGHNITLTGFAKFSTARRRPQRSHDIKTGGTNITQPKRRLVVKGGDVLHRRLQEVD